MLELELASFFCKHTRLDFCSMVMLFRSSLYMGVWLLTQFRSQEDWMRSLEEANSVKL